jgi:hypothetical protein
MVFIGVGLNIFVMQTLGSFSVAAVLLALYLAFWAYVLGSTVLILVSIWLLMRRKLILIHQARPESDDHECLPPSPSKRSRVHDDHRDHRSPTRAA